MMRFHPGSNNLKLLLNFCLLSVLSFVGCTPTELETAASQQSPTMTRPQFKHGVNISHYLSQTSSEGYGRPGYFTEEDISWIAGRGYDHIRLPVDGPLLLDENAEILPGRLESIDKVINSAHHHGLNVLLDIHSMEGTRFSGGQDERLFHDEGLQDKAVLLWTTLARRYQTIGPELRFEILNEPVAENASDVTIFYDKMIRVIRDISPDRTIALCSNRWGRFETVPALKPLFKYGNIVVDVHFYDPHLFTHQKASWVGADVPGIPPIPFPGEVPDLTPYLEKDHYAYDNGGRILTYEEVEKAFADIAKWAAENDVVLYNGEFGVYYKANPEHGKNWYRTVLDQCRKHGIGWAVWDYQGGFAVRDEETKKPTYVQEVIDDYLD